MAQALPFAPRQEAPPEQESAQRRGTAPPAEGRPSDSTRLTDRSQDLVFPVPSPGARPVDSRPPIGLLAHPEVTRRRVEALSDYHDCNIYSERDGFICSSRFSCRDSMAKLTGCSFYEAQGATVAPYYDLVEGDRPLRVMVVPMETGADQIRFSVEKRTAETLKAKRLSFQQRNPHMKGVTFALQLALGGLELGDTPESEIVRCRDGRQVHLFDAFAMVNSALCSAVKTDTMASVARPQMRENCMKHLLRTIEILQPTLLISQGVGVGKVLGDHFAIDRWHADGVAACHVGEVRFAWVGLCHPSVRDRRNWSSLGSSYLQQEVRPRIELARRLDVTS